MLMLNHLAGFNAFTLDNAGYIQSIQTVEITIGNGATSNTATISSVNTARSFVLYNGFRTTYTGVDQSRVLPRVELTNGTTVTALRNTADTATVTVCATVLEFKASAIQSIQQGTITMGSAATSNTATISSITTANAAVFFLGMTTDYTSTSGAVTAARLDITNSTTVTVNRNSTGTASMTVGYVAVEFAAGIINSRQQRSVTLTSANTSDTDTITSVTTGNTLLAYAGHQQASSGISNGCYNLQVTAATTVTLTRTTTSTTTRTINYTALEFAPGIINSIQRGATAIASATSADATITSVNTAKSVLNMVGFSTDTSTWSERSCTAKLLNATTVRGEKNTAGATSATPGWEVVEFL